MNLRQLEYFVAAVDAGTMTEASRRLYVSQSAISLSIAQLESSIDTQLLVRAKGQPLQLTEAGRRVLPRARALLAHAEQVRSFVKDEADVLRGSLVVGCTSLAAPFVLPELLKVFAERQPEIVVDFIEAPSDKLAESLASGRCEIALLYDQNRVHDIVVEPLRTGRPYAVFDPDHPLAGRGSVGLDELAPHPLIMLDNAPSREYHRALFAAAGFQPSVRHYVSTFDMAHALVSRGLGYATMLGWPSVDYSHGGRGLVQVPIHDDPLTNELVLAHSAAVQLSRRAQAFASSCRDIVPRL
ncbi:LysR family transcriptional regulator [Rhodococcus sp. IEGM 1381]|uniref:LysR family transcriptional regulator n=1 Tax=Rhodococcus sp. IEGM 1381 TaxID=3047085 RepID=UPI0024B70236|nr:LysR family transcriptional regulator [Rhodococcus sp. IEGM 1381]MDI9897409.1 LysR family transcriptional regulator [Rhodococcus sp. IEGM 1381]